VRKSIFEELNELFPVLKTDEVLDTRATHIIASVINLFKFIDESYPDEEADYLKKRFISSIKGKDPKRFSRALAKVAKEGN